MNPRELTLEQMEEKQTKTLAFQKAKIEKAIAKLTERAKGVDGKEAERLGKIINNFKAHKKNLLGEDVKATALAKFNKIQEKIKPVIK